MENEALTEARINVALNMLEDIRHGHALKHDALTCYEAWSTVLSLAEYYQRTKDRQISWKEAFLAALSGANLHKGFVEPRDIVRRAAQIANAAVK